MPWNQDSHMTRSMTAIPIVCLLLDLCACCLHFVFEFILCCLPSFVLSVDCRLFCLLIVVCLSAD
jgi:hypothetical protein